ncbi:thiamine-phosphate pyrophosphorylase [Zhihengliuella halotolerans]|uniref:Thiamine-phosphate synthase n=1 Tax=Zhihengliuella halotolerans TaxID=370736 RepID=A0A4Q8AFV1_9MICC|nr:thiamine-phosphate pyrophosphorylase [Zhihengliuella halotolerans]
MSRRYSADDLAIYLVADAESTVGRELADIVAGAVAGGLRMVQLRAKNLPARDFLAATIASAAHTAGRATLVVNDRVDVFLAARSAGAAVDGVHLGQSDLPATAVRELIGADAVLGLSASEPGELDDLASLRAGTVDYLGTGAIRATPTKKDHPDPLGWDGFARFVDLVRAGADASPGSGLNTAAGQPLPCVAIGGVAAGDAAAARSSSAAGLAVVRAICAADDPARAAADLVTEWNQAHV